MRKKMPPSVLRAIVFDAGFNTGGKDERHLRSAAVEKRPSED